MIQGFTGVAAVDAQHQIIVAAVALGSGSEQEILLPMIQRTQPYRTKDTLITADAGYHSEANLKQLAEQGIPALIADGLMRKRDPRLAAQRAARPNRILCTSSSKTKVESSKVFSVSYF